MNAPRRFALCSLAPIVAGVVCIASSAVRAQPTPSATVNVAGPGTRTATVTLAPATVRWVRLDVTSGIHPITANFLDIIAGSSLGLDFATSLALYDAFGSRIAIDMDDGPGQHAMLSFGGGCGAPARTTPAGSGSPPLPEGEPRTGQDGWLRESGSTYWLAIAGAGVSFGATGWNVTSSSTVGGVVNCSIVLGSAGTAATLPLAVPNQLACIGSTVTLSVPPIHANRSVRWFRFDGLTPVALTASRFEGVNSNQLTIRGVAPEDASRRIGPGSNDFLGPFFSYALDEGCGHAPVFVGGGNLRVDFWGGIGSPPPAACSPIDARFFPSADNPFAVIGNSSGPEPNVTSNNTRSNSLRISGGGSTGSGFDVFASVYGRFEPGFGSTIAQLVPQPDGSLEVLVTATGSARCPLDNPDTTADDSWFAFLEFPSPPALRLREPVWATVTNRGTVRMLIDGAVGIRRLDIGDYAIPLQTLLVSGQVPQQDWSIDTTIRLTRTAPLNACDSIDFNNNALFPEDQDLIDLLSILAGGPCSTNTCNDIDFNNDGLFPDDSDLIAFLAVLAGGNCS